MNVNNVKIETLKAVEQQFGIFFALHQWDDFERKFISACKSLNIKQHEVALNQFITGNFTNKQIEVLIEHLTIGETYFFREKECLTIFRETMLMPLLESKKTLKKEIQIWSAGCCTGEEPYTLAMLLLETIPQIEHWHIKILATDINSIFLEKAKQGKYKKWSLRATPEWAINKYFAFKDDHYQLKPEVLDMVEFRKVNLIEESAFPSAAIPLKNFDFIYCRNVLMYFTPAIVEKIAQRFSQCLTDNGWFITSPVEVPSQGLINLSKVKIRNHMFFQKGSSIVSTDRILIPNIQITSKLPVSKSEYRETIKQQTIEDSIAKKPVRSEEKTRNDYLDAARHYKLHNYLEAIPLLEKTLQADSKHLEAQIMLVNAYANNRQTFKAMEICKLFLAKNNHARLYYLLATIEEEMGNDHEAESHLRQALYIDHKFLIAHFMMGNLLQKQGNAKAADKCKQNLQKLLQEYEPDCELQDFEGMTAQSLIEMITKPSTWKH